MCTFATEKGPQIKDASDPLINFLMSYELMSLI